ncbi:MAG: HAD family phosphatase [Chitinophagaceae bacterium]|nr:HAD family phosphatase [Chitinophagaceae bacterium]
MHPATHIRNIIFDYGGVIIDIDMKRTEDAFIRLGVKDFNQHFNQLKQTTLFDNFDKGKITEQEFRDQLNKELGTQFSDQQINDAWNAMLGEIPKEKLKLLMDVRHTYRTFLLSNTNIIHLKQITKYMVQAFGRPNIDAYFDKVYYSFVVGLRKPDADIFLKVLEENNLKPEETLFIDDSPQHVEGAKSAGLHALLYNPGEDLRIFLENYLQMKIGAAAS